MWLGAELFVQLDVPQELLLGLVLAQTVHPHQDIHGIGQVVLHVSLDPLASLVLGLGEADFVELHREPQLEDRCREHAEMHEHRSLTRPRDELLEVEQPPDAIVTRFDLRQRVNHFREAGDRGLSLETEVVG